MPPISNLLPKRAQHSSIGDAKSPWPPGTLPAHDTLGTLAVSALQRLAQPEQLPSSGRLRQGLGLNLKMFPLQFPSDLSYQLIKNFL